MKATLLALGLLFYAAVAPAAEAIPAATAYAADPQHLWNRLNSILFARVAPEGTVYGLDELDILYWQGTEHLLTGPSHSAAVQILDRFIRAHGERLIRDPFKRVLLQRDLWELFDWAAMPGQTMYPAQRTELEERLATVIRRLALSDAEIAALPDNYATAAVNPDLPQDLFAPDGDWVTVRSNDSAFGPLASLHTEAFNGHSVFLVMVRLPLRRSAGVCAAANELLALSRDQSRCTAVSGGHEMGARAAAVRYRSSRAHTPDIRHRKYPVAAL
jgi:hypothetical protein